METDRTTKKGTGTSSTGAAEAKQLVVAEDRAVGKVGKATYLSYLAAGGGAQYFLAVCVVSGLCQLARIGADVWLAIWSEGTDSGGVDEAEKFLPGLVLTPAQYVGVYGLITLLVIPLNIGRTLGFTWGTVRSARNLHNAVRTACHTHTLSLSLSLSLSLAAQTRP